MIRLYTILNDPIAYKKLLIYVRKYHPERYNRYNQLKFSQKDQRYKRGFRIPDMDTMEEIALDYKKVFLDTRSRKDIALWLLEITD